MYYADFAVAQYADAQLCNCVQGDKASKAAFTVGKITGFVEFNYT